jgi:hypothetical protein
MGGGVGENSTAFSVDKNDLICLASIAIFMFILHINPNLGGYIKRGCHTAAKGANLIEFSIKRLRNKKKS